MGQSNDFAYSLTCMMTYPLIHAQVQSVQLAHDGHLRCGRAGLGGIRTAAVREIGKGMRSSCRPCIYAVISTRLPSLVYLVTSIR